VNGFQMRRQREGGCFDNHDRNVMALAHHVNEATWP
jgi:hypothetical protein